MPFFLTFRWSVWVLIFITFCVTLIRLTFSYTSVPSCQESWQLLSSSLHCTAESVKYRDWWGIGIGRIGRGYGWWTFHRVCPSREVALGDIFGANAFFVDVSFAMTVVQFSLGPEVVQIFREKLIFAWSWKWEQNTIDTLQITGKVGLWWATIQNSVQYIHTFQTKYYSNYKMQTKQFMLYNIIFLTASQHECNPTKISCNCILCVLCLCCICIVFLLYLYYKPGLRSISQCHKTKISCGEVQAMQSSGSHHETQVPSKDYFGRSFLAI